MAEIEVNEIKKPNTIDELIELMKSRGLTIRDSDFADNTLRNINYYRLSAYNLSLQREGFYNRDTTFENILNLHEFDRKLRIEIMQMLEIIEISFRARIAYYLAHSYGPLAYKDANHFADKALHQAMLDNIELEILRSKEKFVEHHKLKYAGEFPIWVTVEIMSFSQLSKMYSNLLNDDKTNIAKLYNNTHSYISNWLHVLSITRNICAHFGRLYGRNLPYKIKFTKKNMNTVQSSNSIFALIFIAFDLIEDSSTLNNFITSIKRLFDEYKEVDPVQLGFPEDWEEILTRRAKERVN